MSYFKNDVHLLFLQIPHTKWEPVHDYLLTQYEPPEQLEGTYQTIVENSEMDKDHLVLYVVCNPYERMICSLFSLGKINTNSTKEEVFHALQFCPTQFSYVSFNDKLVPSKIIHLETLNQDMNAIGYECNISADDLPFMNYLNDKSIHAINVFYEKDFEMFQYEKHIPTPKRHYSQISIGNSYYPSKYASLYGWNTYVETDAVIFVCSFGGSLPQATTTSVGTNIVQVNTSDIHTYWSKQGISASPLYMYTSPDANTNSDSFENNMDCSILGSLCGCKIVLCVFSPYDTFTTAFQFMLAGVTVSNQLLKPTHISISWGCPESTMESIDKTLYLKLRNTKVTICAAAGDGNCDSTNEPLCNFPASCPYVISVGGTSIQSLHPFSEITWNVNATGGISKVFNRPYYQSCSGTMRNVPDIVSISDPNTGIYLYYNGQLNPGNGGTSMASPFVTAMFAITGFQCKQKNQLSTYPNIVPVLYSLSCFNDCTKGIDSETGYNCSLGSIQWDTFSNNINKIFTPPPTPTPPTPTPPPPPPPPPPRMNIPTQIILNSPFKITLPLYAVYFIQNPAIAYLSNNIIYPRKKGTTQLFVYLIGKWYICDIKV
jgi:hypothetical protein